MAKRREKRELEKVIDLLKMADLRMRVELPSKNEARLDALEEIGRAISGLYEIQSQLNIEMLKL